MSPGKINGSQGLTWDIFFCGRDRVVNTKLYCVFLWGNVGIIEKRRSQRLCGKSKYCLCVFACTYSREDLTQSGGWWEKPWWLLMHVIAEGHQQAIHSNWWTPIYWSFESLQREDEGSLWGHMLSLRGCSSTVQPWKHDVMLLCIC